MHIYQNITTSINNKLFNDFELMNKLLFND